MNPYQSTEEKQYFNAFFYAFLAFFVLNLCLRLQGTMLWDEDETAYAAFARRMLQTGDWIKQDFIWCKIHRKPPLHFWTILFWYHIFGIKEWVVRLPSILAACGTMGILYFGLRKVYSERLAQWTCIVLGSSILMPNIAKIGVLDSELLFYETTATIALLRVLHQKSWQWTAIFWISFALGVLQKGPPIMILSGGMFLFLAFAHKNGRNLWSMQPFLCLPIAMLPILIWGWMAWQKDNGDFIRFLWDWYILKRVSGDNVVNTTWTGPPGYHLVVLLVSFLVWMPFFVPALLRWGKAVWARQNDAIFILGWLIFSWFFYEITPSKLPAYSIAAQPAIALLIAQQVMAWQAGERSYLALIKGTAIFQLILMVSVAGALIYFAQKLFATDAILNVLPLALTLSIGVLLLVIQLFANSEHPFWRSDNIVYVMVGKGLWMTFFAWLTVLPLVEAKRNATKRAAKIAAQLKGIRQDAVLVYALDPGVNMPSIAFYAQQSFKLATDPPDYESDFYWYKGSTPVVVITDDANFDHTYRQFVPESKVVKIPIWLIDRNRTNNYYIFRNF